MEITESAELQENPKKEERRHSSEPLNGSLKHSSKKHKKKYSLESQNEVENFNSNVTEFFDSIAAESSRIHEKKKKKKQVSASQEETIPEAEFVRTRASSSSIKYPFDGQFFSEWPTLTSGDESQVSSEAENRKKHKNKEDKKLQSSDDSVAEIKNEKFSDTLFNNETEEHRKTKKHKKKHREELESEVLKIDESDVNLSVEKNKKRKKHKHLEEENDTLQQNSRSKELKKHEKHLSSASSEYSESSLLDETCEESPKKKKKKRKYSEDDLKNETISENSLPNSQESYDISTADSALDQFKKIKKNKKHLEKSLKTEEENPSEQNLPEEISERPKKKKKRKYSEDNLKSERISEDSLHESFDKTTNSQSSEPPKKIKKHKKNLEESSKTERKSVNSSGDENELSDGNSSNKKRERKCSEQSLNGDILLNRPIEPLLILTVGSPLSETQEEKPKNSVENSGDLSQKNENLEHNEENSGELPECTDSISQSEESKKKKKSEKSGKKKNSTSGQTPDYCTLEKIKIIKRKKRMQPERDTPLKVKAVFSKCKYKNDEDDDEIQDETISKKYFNSALEDTKEENQINSEEYQLLKGLHVMIPWPIPPLHMIETSVIAVPTKNQQKKIEELRVKKTGFFTREEDMKIKENWEKFYKMHDLPNNPKLFYNPKHFQCLSRRERVNFVRFLGHGLDDRLLRSIYQRYKKLFRPEDITLGRFTPEEDRTIVEYIKNSSSNTPYADLAAVLNRDSLSVLKRSFVLCEHLQGAVGIKWSTPMIEEFMRHFVDVLGVGNLEELKDRTITPKEWKKMQDRLDIPVRKLKKAWLNNIYSRIFVKRRTNTSELKHFLTSLMIERGDKDWKEVNWNEICAEVSNEFEGFTPQKLCKIMRMLVNQHVPHHMKEDLGAALEVLNDSKKIGGHNIKRLKIIDHRTSDV